MSKDLTQSAQATKFSGHIPPESLLGRCLGLPLTSDFDLPFRSEEKKLIFREIRKEHERIIDADEKLK